MKTGKDDDGAEQDHLWQFIRMSISRLLLTTIPFVSSHTTYLAINLHRQTQWV